MTSEYICALTLIRIITQRRIPEKRQTVRYIQKTGKQSEGEPERVRIDSERRFHLQSLNLGFMCRWRGLIRFSQILPLSDLLIILSSKLTFMCV